ncbi:hypothetical protein QTP86_021206 [Hemibagrus guttatus]|nr:hypothetical protein QTP86_021206 [Hemibagrus guttatus]
MKLINPSERQPVMKEILSEFGLQGVSNSFVPTKVPNVRYELSETPVTVRIERTGSAQKLVNPRNRCNSFMVVGSGQFVTTVTFLGCISTPCCDMTYPMKEIEFLWNSHVELVLVQTDEYCPDMAHVVDIGGGVNQDVVDVNDHILVDQPTAYQDFVAVRDEALTLIHKAFAILDEQFRKLDREKSDLSEAVEALCCERQAIDEYHQKQSQELQEMLERHKLQNEAWLRARAEENDKERKELCKLREEVLHEQEKLKEEQCNIQKRSEHLLSIMQQFKGM